MRCRAVGGRVERLAVTFALSLAIGGCAGEPSTMSVDLSTLPAKGIDWSSLSIHVSGPHATRTYRRADFQPQSSGVPLYHAPSLTFRGSGQATIVVRYTGMPGGTTVETRSEFKVQPDYHYGIEVHLGGVRPGPFFCALLFGAVQLPPPASPESLFVVFAGLPKGAVC